MYYINEQGNCRIANFIQHCLIYKSERKCFRCAENYFVSEDEASCEIQGAGFIHDMTNCEFLVYKAEKQCMVCHPGYFFINGKCSPCNAGEGCEICDF